MKKQAVLSLSGGMDSSTLLLHLMANDYAITALSFDYGQKHKVELERAQSLISYINGQFVVDEKEKTIDYPFYVDHQVIKIEGLQNLLNSALVEGGKEVPEGHYEQDNMKETVVPNRNKIFSSLIQAVALSIANKNNTQCYIAMGIHSGDHAIYPDCRQEFRDADMEAFRIGNWEAEKVLIYTPYLLTDKFGILQDGLECCEKLGLDFDEVYKRTNTSYKPIPIGTIKLQTQFSMDGGQGWVEWFSDYKSASSVERIEAFIKLGRPDPVNYADLSGPVSWEVVRDYVLKVLEEHNK